MTQSTNKRPSHTVYVVDDTGKKSYWTKVGSAWTHDDGKGFNLQLSALPLDGRLVIRVAKDKPEAGR